MKFTDAQLAAMNLHGRTLLVSAAAGSGKTFTLTQRIIQSIINDGRDISNLLIVTFTRAAAGELRAKISKAISEAIEKNPDNQHLQSQLLKLGSAHISTIDSFFSEPVKANFEKLGLPAAMRLSDEAELEPLRFEIMREVLNRFFEKCDGLACETVSSLGYSDSFTQLMGMISSARNSSAIVPMLLEIYKKLITAPEGIGQLRKHSERMRRSADLDFFDTLEGSALRDEIVSVLNYTAATFKKCCDEMRDYPTLAEKYIPCFAENETMCISLSVAVASGSYEQARAAFDLYKPSRIPPLRGDDKTAISEYYKDLRGEKLNPGVKDLKKKYLVHSAEEISDFFRDSADKCDLICHILEEFDKDYSAEKLSRAICEFSDMPKFMLRLLQNKDGTPTEYANALSEQFDEVYIDEYQDVNEIQDRIFELIGRSHRFMVGDIKQSIYGFREAEPSIFADYRRRFKEYDKNNDTVPLSDSGSTVFMSNNFRCDENVIRFTNLVCSRIFSVFAESIGYTSNDDLIFTKEKPSEDYLSPRVTINIVENPSTDEEESENDGDGGTEEEPVSQHEEKPDKLYDEAMTVANEIARLVREEKKADNTPVRFGDIAILVRSHSSSKALAAAMSKLNIKYTLSSGGELFDSKEMKLLVDLLSVIDNPRIDVPLSSLLTAEMGSEPILSMEELITVRRAIPSSKSLYDALIDYRDTDEGSTLESKCRDFIAELGTLRRIASTLSADKLLRHICHSKRYSALCSCDAYNYLYDCACKYVRQSWNGLYNFLVYFKRLVEKGESGAEPAKSGGDAVTVMTIHQSKGLEFPVCFLFAMNKQFNLMDSRAPIIFSKDFGLSMKLPPKFNDDTDVIEKIKVRFKENELWRAADVKIKQRQIEEEARIFYVALTRARERLYLSATINKAYDEYIDDLISCADAAYEIKKGKSYLRQTLLSLSDSLREPSDIFDINVFTSGEVTPAEAFGSAMLTQASDSIAVNDSERELMDLMKLKLGESEDEQILASIPAKVAASKVSHTMLDDSIFTPIPTGMLFSESDEDTNEQSADSLYHIRNRIALMRSQSPDFDSLLEINKKPTAAEKGTAVHQFLQFCDYENASTQGLDAEIERLLSKKFITERNAKIIDRRQLKGFFESELFSIIRNAKELHREFKFGLFRPAEDFTEDEKIRSAVAGKKIYVQGSIDLLIETSDGELLLCDYKTDRITPEERKDPDLLYRNMVQKHGAQLKEYSYAIEQIFGKAPSKMFIYSVILGMVVEM